jgi:hypothetical protein
VISISGRSVLRVVTVIELADRRAQIRARLVDAEAPERTATNGRVQARARQACGRSEPASAAAYYRRS